MVDLPAFTSTVRADGADGTIDQLTTHKASLLELSGTDQLEALNWLRTKGFPLLATELAGHRARRREADGKTARQLFDSTTLTYSGTPVQQARLLLRHVGLCGDLGPTRSTLPGPFNSLPGTSTRISRRALEAYVRQQGIDPEQELGGLLTAPLSRGRDGSANAPEARYFVIHDTSDELEGATFPNEIDTESWSGNRLDKWKRLKKVRTHVFVNRLGESTTTADFSRPTPHAGTRHESPKSAHAAAKGMYLHVELVQPRIRDPETPDEYHKLAPEEGFTQKQYDRLALLYVAASIRKGEWLIPAFHSALDDGYKYRHDDPQGFDLERWAQSVEDLTRRLRANR